MIDRLMVPLDGSALAERVIPTVIAVARRGCAVVHLVRVHQTTLAVVDDDRLDDIDGIADVARAKESQYLSAVARRVESGGVPVTTAVVDGATVLALSDYAVAQGVGLVVMSTHGRTGVSRAWFGSVADGLVRAAPVPVLMVRAVEDADDAGHDTSVAGSDEPTLAGILVPLDGSARAEAVLDPAAELAALFGGSLILLRVLEPTYAVPEPLGYPHRSPTLDEELHLARIDRADDYLRAVVARLGRAHPGVPVRAEVRTFERTAHGILERACAADIDLIALTTRGRGRTRALLGSVADKVLRGTTRPLLLLRSAVRPVASSVESDADRLATRGR